jgi:hypothetical protein
MVTEIISNTNAINAMSGDTEAKALSLVMVTKRPIMNTSIIAQGLTMHINLNPIASPGGMRPKLSDINKYIITIIFNAGIKNVVMSTNIAIVGIPSCIKRLTACSNVVELVKPCELIVTIGNAFDIKKSTADVIVNTKLSFKPLGCERYNIFAQPTHLALSPAFRKGSLCTKSH